MIARRKPPTVAEERAAREADALSLLLQRQEGQPVTVPLLETFAARSFPRWTDAARGELAALAFDLHRQGRTPAPEAGTGSAVERQADAAAAARFGDGGRPAWVRVQELVRARLEGVRPEAVGTISRADLEELRAFVLSRVPGGSVWTGDLRTFWTAHVFPALVVGEARRGSAGGKKWKRDPRECAEGALRLDPETSGADLFALVMRETGERWASEVSFRQTYANDAAARVVDYPTPPVPGDPLPRLSWLELHALVATMRDRQRWYQKEGPEAVFARLRMVGVSPWLDSLERFRLGVYLPADRFGLYFPAEVRKAWDALDLASECARLVEGVLRLDGAATVEAVAGALLEECGAHVPPAALPHLAECVEALRAGIQKEEREERAKAEREERERRQGEARKALAARFPGWWNRWAALAPHLVDVGGEDVGALVEDLGELRGLLCTALPGLDGAGGG